MSKTLQLINHVPARATKQNISTILHTMEVFDVRADKAHTAGNFSRATELSNFVMELDALVACYRGVLPEGNE